MVRLKINPSHLVKGFVAANLQSNQERENPGLVTVRCRWGLPGMGGRWQRNEIPRVGG